MKTLEDQVKRKKTLIEALIPTAVPEKPSSDGLANMAEWKLLHHESKAVREWTEGWDKGWGKWGK